jgi:hypothetical protein
MKNLLIHPFIHPLLELEGGAVTKVVLFLPEFLEV